MEVKDRPKVIRGREGEVRCSASCFRPRTGAGGLPWLGDSEAPRTGQPGQSQGLGWSTATRASCTPAPNALVTQPLLRGFLAAPAHLRANTGSVASYSSESLYIWKMKVFCGLGLGDGSELTSGWAAQTPLKVQSGDLGRKTNAETATPVNTGGLVG